MHISINPQPLLNSYIASLDIQIWSFPNVTQVVRQKTNNYISAQCADMLHISSHLADMYLPHPYVVVGAATETARFQVDLKFRFHERGPERAPHHTRGQ